MEIAPRTRNSWMKRVATFVGGDTGIWRVTKMKAVAGPPLKRVDRIAVIEGNLAALPVGGKCYPPDDIQSSWSGLSRNLISFINDTSRRIVNTMARCMQTRKTAKAGSVTLFEPKVKVASQSVFYAWRTHDGTCASGCGVSRTRVAEIVFGIEIVEWDLCSACISRTGFLEYFNSLPSATSREAEEIRILLGISNETFQRAARTPTIMVGDTTAEANSWR